MDISRLSLAIADLPLTPFGMRKPSPASLQKVNADKATSKLSRKSPFSAENTSKFHPSQIRGPKGKENFSPLHNAVNSEDNDPFHPKNIKPKSSRRLLAPKTNKLPILLEDDSSDPFMEPPLSRQDKNKSSETGKMKNKELHKIIEKHYENNTKSFEDLSVSKFNPSKVLSSTRIDPRRESIMTDIDEGTLVEFTKTEPHGREIQHVDSLAVIRNNHLYISAQSHLNETQCSTSTKKNNARYNFHQLVDAVKKQKMLQQISRVEETSVDSSPESSDNEFALPAPKALASTFLENKRFSQCPLSIPDISSLSIHSNPIVDGENSSSTDFDYVPFLPKKQVIITTTTNTIPEIASDSIPSITKRVRPVPEIESSSGILPSQTSSDSIPLNTLCNSKGKSNCKELSYPEGFASEEVEFVDVIASALQSTSLVSEDVSVVDNNTIHKSTALKTVNNSLISEDDIEELPEEPIKHKVISPLKTKCTEKCPDTPMNRPNARCNVATPKHADKNTNTPVSGVKKSVFQWVANSPFKDGSFSASFMNEKTKKTADHSKEAISETSYEEEESSDDEIVNTSEPEIIKAKTPIINTRKLETVKSKTPITNTEDTEKLPRAVESQTLHLALADDSTSTQQQTPAVRTKKLYPQISLEDSDDETETCAKYSKASKFKNRYNNVNRSAKSSSKTNNKVEIKKALCSNRDKEVYKRNLDTMASPELKSSKINQYEIQKQSVSKTTKKKSVRKRIILADSSESSDDNSPMKPKTLQKKSSRGSASSSSISLDSENVTSKYFKTPSMNSENTDKVQQKEHSKARKHLDESSESEDELSSYMEGWGKQKKKEEVVEQSDSDDSFINDEEESENSSEEDNEEEDVNIPKTMKGTSGNELPKRRKDEKQVKGTKFLKDSNHRSLPNDKSDRKVDEDIVTISDSDEELPTKYLTPKNRLRKLKTNNLELENTVMQPKKNQFYTPQAPKNVSQLTKVLNSVTKMNSSPCLSFMASLGPDVPSHKQHSDAQKYTKNFMKTREQLATKLYEMFNAKAFDNGLPSNMSITWNVNLTKTAGRCFYLIDKSVDSGRAARIELSNKVLTEPYRLRDTLVHEMVHACSWVISAYKDGHGKLFKAWASKAMFEFPELPKISTCHSYKITCKYTYKCTKCNHRYERHSKSIDTSKKACGRCKGSLEVFLTKKLDSGNVGALPATPAPFAAFVKENYSSVKKADYKLRHNEIMKTLGEQFKRMKAS